MAPRHTPHGRSPALASVILSLVVIVALAGCSSQPQQILGPSQSAAGLVATADPSRVQAASQPAIDRENYPRMRVWTDDGWRQYQREGGVSLDPSRIYDLDIPELQPVTFHWAAQPQGHSLGTRWAVDLADIFDETPRSGPDDVAHWSPWSASERSATVGPFSEGPDHFFYVAARDDLGFISLLTVRLRVLPASAGVAEAPPAKH